MPDQDSQPRSRQLYDRAYKLHGYGHVSAVARAIGMNRAYVSLILNGLRVQPDVLDAVEEHLNAIEAEGGEDA